MIYRSWSMWNRSFGCVTPTAVPPLSHQSSPPLPNSRPAATPIMARYKAKAKSNKKQKKEEEVEEEEEEELEPGEYLVGASLLRSNAYRHSTASLEKVTRAKVNIISKGTVHWVSAFLHRPSPAPQSDHPPSTELPR